MNDTVEATTLNERTFALRSQDRFLRDNIAEDDVLIVSIGGNDIALLPLPCTIVSMAGLVCLPSSLVRNGFRCCVVPVRASDRARLVHFCLVTFDTVRRLLLRMWRVVVVLWRIMSSLSRILISPVWTKSTALY